jgi:hypothetical protein
VPRKDSCPVGFPAARLYDVAVTNEKVDSVRFSRFEKKRLAWALALSLAAHFLVWGGYELGQKIGLWQKLHWPSHKQLAVKKVTPPVQESDPTIFLDVDQATPDAPKSAKYYSAKNSRAAQSEAGPDLNQPKLNGKQTDVPDTKDVPRTPNTKVQPAPAPQPPTQEKMAAPPPSLLQPGDLKLAKLETSPEKNDTPPKPRTLAEARAQQQAASPRPQIQMQQNGGTRRIAVVPSLDARSTPFGDYDKKFIEAVEQRWYDLLDSQQFAMDRTGKVTVQFRLHYDGSISDMEVLQNTVGYLLCLVCQKAVTDPAPFEAWPSDMRRMVGENYREMIFTFYYY